MGLLILASSLGVLIGFTNTCILIGGTDGGLLTLASTLGVLMGVYLHLHPHYRY